MQIIWLIEIKDVTLQPILRRGMKNLFIGIEK